jgi:hypothetical protein
MILWVIRADLRIQIPQRAHLVPFAIGCYHRPLSISSVFPQWLPIRKKAEEWGTKNEGSRR